MGRALVVSRCTARWTHRSLRFVRAGDYFRSRERVEERCVPLWERAQVQALLPRGG